MKRIYWGEPGTADAGFAGPFLRGRPRHGRRGGESGGREKPRTSHNGGPRYACCSATPQGGSDPVGGDATHNSAKLVLSPELVNSPSGVTECFTAAASHFR